MSQTVELQKTSSRANAEFSQRTKNKDAKKKTALKLQGKGSCTSNKNKRKQEKSLSNQAMRLNSSPFTSGYRLFISFSVKRLEESQGREFRVTASYLPKTSSYEPFARSFQQKYQNFRLL